MIMKIIIIIIGLRIVRYSRRNIPQMFPTARPDHEGGDLLKMMMIIMKIIIIRKIIMTMMTMAIMMTMKIMMIMIMMTMLIMIDDQFWWCSSEHEDDAKDRPIPVCFYEQQALGNLNI